VTDDALLAAAVLNNALWCDTVCRAHARPGSFGDLLWTVRLGAPPLYPDVVTIAGPAAADAQRAAIIALIAGGRPGDWAVKDSYATLNLASLGFHPLFDASWFVHRSPAACSPTMLDWRSIADASDLAAWNEAWAQDAPFAPALMAEDGIVFLAAHHDATLVGGAILNRSAGVVGLSNVFAAPQWADALWRDLPAIARRLFAGLLLVGYERGDDLDRAIAMGFEALGPLRVWLKPAHR
jgi:hypothetical protein